jgi:hypothetical protein
MKTISNLLAPLVLCFCFGLAVPLAADGFAFWDFNSPVPDANLLTGTTAPAFGSGTAALAGGTTAGFGTGTARDTGSPGDNSGWNTSGYPPQGTGNKTAGVRFNVSTAGRRNIGITWEQRSSASGSKYTRLQYSTNGLDFVDMAAPIVAQSGGTFFAKTCDLSGVAGVNDNPEFAFRIVAEFESTALGTANEQYVAANSGSSYNPGSIVSYDLVKVAGDLIPPSANADLASLMLTSGTLTPAFDPAVTDYTANVLHSVTSIALTATCADPTATLQVRVNGGAFSNVLSGQTSPPLALNVGTNLIDIKVTAQDFTTTKIYTIAVTRAVNQAPVANAGADRTPYTGQTIALSGSVFDADGDPIVFWAWAVVQAPDGATWDFSGADTSSPLFAGFSPGDYVVSLFVGDSTGLFSEFDYATIHVITNQPPVAVATADKTTITVGDTVCFDGSQSSDPEGGPLTYIWEFRDGSPADFNQVSVCHTFAEAGTFDVGLQVTDERGAYDFDVITITVLPKLRIEVPAPNTVLLAWPAAATGYSLEQNADLSTGNWQPVTTPPEVVGAENQVTLPATPPRNFFRLRTP